MEAVIETFATRASGSPQQPVVLACRTGRRRRGPVLAKSCRHFRPFRDPRRLGLLASKLTIALSRLRPAIRRCAVPLQRSSQAWFATARQCDLQLLGSHSPTTAVDPGTLRDAAERLGPYRQRCYENGRLRVRCDMRQDTGHCRVCDMMLANAPIKLVELVETKVLAVIPSTRRSSP